MTMFSRIRKVFSRSHTAFFVLLNAAILLLGFSSAAFAAPQISPNALSEGRIGVIYSQTLEPHSSGVAPFTWSVDPVYGIGRLPRGMGLDVTGEPRTIRFKGVPSEAGTFDFRIIANSATGVAYAQAYNWFVRGTRFEISPASIVSGRVGTPYLQPLTAPWSPTWSIAPGSILPSGLTLNATTGALSGTPTVVGSSTFLVLATDLSTGNFGEHWYTLVVESAVTPLGITTLLNPIDGRAGVAYPGQIFLATGGVLPYAWYTTGSPPPGLSVSADGYLTGTPTTPGTYSFNVKVRDAVGTLEGHSYTMTIASPTVTVLPTPLAITTDALPSGTESRAYSSVVLSASGGASPFSPYVWELIGTPPAGMRLSSAGVWSGTPTLRGSYTVTVKASDSTGASVTRAYSFTVLPPPVILTGPILPVTPFVPTGSSSGTSGGSTPTDAALTTRLSNFTRIGVSIHALVKLPDDGNRFTQEDSAVYYLGGDGRRHAFPNNHVYATWYPDFSGVRIVSATDLASIPLGMNVTYKPGVKLVKFLTDPKVYAVSTDRQLRWVKTEAIAIALYGSTWNRQVDDVADTFYLDYRMGTEIGSASDYSPASLQTLIRYPGDVLPLL